MGRRAGFGIAVSASAEEVVQGQFPVRDMGDSVGNAMVGQCTYDNLCVGLIVLDEEQLEWFAFHLGDLRSLSQVSGLSATS